MIFVLRLSFLFIKLAVILLALASIATTCWVSLKATYDIIHMAYEATRANFAHVLVNMVAIVDGYLLAVLLFLVACSLHELFFKEIPWLPNWLKVKNLEDLKHNLSSVVTLMLAVIFMEHLFSWQKPLATLYFAGAIFLVMVALILYLKVKIEALRFGLKGKV
ncbi:YqhA family protein [Thermosulfuriphilus sp.]